MKVYAAHVLDEGSNFKIKTPGPKTEPIAFCADEIWSRNK